MLGRKEYEKVGELMVASHQSLRDDYEVSSPELDFLSGEAMKVKGVYGARMTGGGFGGCTINLVKADSVAEFKRTVASGYEQATGLTPEIFVCSTADGVSQSFSKRTE